MGLPPLATVASEKEGMRVKHTEFLVNLQGGSSSKSVVTKKFTLGSTGLTMLDSLSRAFTRFVLHSLHVVYRPAVGTQRDGLAVIAVDWNSEDTAPTDAKLRVMQPQIRGPVWQPGKMTLPAAQLQQKRNLMTGDEPFALQLGAIDPVATYGEILVTYDVSMMGPSGN